MPVFPPYLPTLQEVRVNQTFPGGVEGVNVLYVSRNGVGDITVEQNEIIDATEALYTALAGTLSDQWSADSITIIDRAVANGQQIERSTAITGVDTNDALPTQTQAVVTLKTAFSGRRYRGRTFVGGWGSANTDTNGDMLPAVPTFLVAEFTAWNNALVADGHEPVVLSRGNDDPLAPNGPWDAFYTPVNAFVVNREWDVLRSRRK